MERVGQVEEQLRGAIFSNHGDATVDESVVNLAVSRGCVQKIEEMARHMLASVLCLKMSRSPVQILTLLLPSSIHLCMP